jgi:hypothetical protein
VRVDLGIPRPTHQREPAHLPLARFCRPRFVTQAPPCASHAGTFDSGAGAAQSAGAKKAYAAVCKTLATEYEGGDKVSQVMREVDQVKGVMSENINQAMSNLESTEALDEKTQEMKQQSNMFNKQAKTAKNQMWWKNMKLNIIIGCVVLIIIFALLNSAGLLG